MIQTLLQTFDNHIVHVIADDEYQRVTATKNHLADYLGVIHMVDPEVQLFDHLFIGGFELFLKKFMLPRTAAEIMECLRRVVGKYSSVKPPYVF